MIVTVVQFVFPFDESRLHPIDMHLVGNNARRIVARQLRLMNRRKIRHSLSRDIRQVDVAGLRICAILWTAEYNSVLIGIACAVPDNKLCRSVRYTSEDGIGSHHVPRAFIIVGVQMAVCRVKNVEYQRWCRWNCDAFRTRGPDLR